MCRVEGETINNLFNEYIEASMLWDRGASFFRQLDRIRGNLIQTQEG
jgi:hypothetical protein